MMNIADEFAYVNMPLCYVYSVCLYVISKSSLLKQKSAASLYFGGNRCENVSKKLSRISLM